VNEGVQLSLRQSSSESLVFRLVLLVALLLFRRCVSRHSLNFGGCNIEVMQQEVEVETAPPPKKKRIQGKVLRCGRKRLALHTMFAYTEYV